jgi:hypothetical protein
LKNALKFFAVAVIIFVCTNSAAFAKDIYPPTLGNGDFILVDGGMGVGYYADKNSVYVHEYKPPFYQIQINIVPVTFSDEYFKQNGNYIGSPYSAGDYFTMTFRYNWDTKTIFTQNEKGIWKNWDINRNYSHADGNPLIPNSAEVAFVSAYHIKFFGDIRNSGGYSVVSENIYDSLGI